MRAGAVPAPVCFLDTTENFAHYARDSYAKLIVAEDALLERLPAGAMARTEFEALLAEHRVSARPPTRTADDMAFWLFSGGSTGLPEGRRAPAPRHPVHVRDLRARRSSRSPSDDVTFSSTKLYHAYGLGNNLTFPYWVGATTVLRPGKPDPQGPAGDRAGATGRRCSSACPTLYGAMVNLPDAAEHDLSSVRFCVSAAEPLAPEVCAAGRQCFGLDIVDGIGSTEMLHIYCSNRPATSARARAASPSRATSSCCSTSTASRCRTARSATCTSAVTARSPTTGTSTRRPRPRSRASGSSPATATGSNENG